MDSHLGYSVYVIMLQVVDICGLFLDTWEGVVTVIFLHVDGTIYFSKLIQINCGFIFRMKLP